eukprot:CAMPEP_0183708928 /NCGR_PEP_ID=MMETSP0737-20130205/5083_1 /TAXON_ID=385413 /ORGANISM="Thalassiosira miniscula, Strain CCMP1093" /LENGTH=557 /DNA_ID=CAMNT_0025936891 /DNA_START=115 /DNA_END=1788 /DNA_ORIENTATION=+
MSSAKLPAKHSQESMEASKPPAKRSRKAKNESSTVINATLPLDAMSFVMQFLPPRSLLNFAFTCKSLRDSLTTKMVVESSLIHGGYAKKSMEELHLLMNVHSMHVPSPLRLLRISNGKSCEFCHGCKVNHVRPGIGVFGCWDCVTIRKLTKPWKRDWARYRHNREKYDAIFNHPRIGFSDYGKKLYFLAHRMKDKAGERIGNLAKWGDVDELASRNEVTNGAIEAYLTDTLHAPSVESYNEFNQAFAEMQQRAERTVAEKAATKRAKKASNKQTKMAKAETMLNDIALLVDERYRDDVMRRSPNRMFLKDEAKISKVPAFIMEAGFVHNLLRDYIITPSKMKKKTMKEMADAINGKVEMIVNKDVLSAGFLPVDSPFKQYLREVTPSSIDALIEQTRSTNFYVDDKSTRFISLVEKDQLLAALASLQNDDLSPVLLTTEPTALLSRSTEYFDSSSLKKIVEAVWRDATYEIQSSNQRCSHKPFEKNDAYYFDLLAKSQSLFRQYLQKLNRYAAWLKDKHKDDERKIKCKVRLVASEFIEYIDNSFASLDKMATRSWG